MIKHMYHIFLIKSITLWNACTSYCTSFKQMLYRTYTDAKHYCNNDHATWIFLPGHTLPLPRSFISNLDTYSWQYDQSTNQLTHTEDVKDSKSYSFSWLSVTLVVSHQGTHEYDMDPFLESFRVHTDKHHPPTLHMVFMAWCAKHSLWFPKNCVVTMRVIDHVGNEMILNLSTHNDSISIHWDKLHTSIPSGIHPYEETYPIIRPATPSVSQEN